MTGTQLRMARIFAIVAAALTLTGVGVISAPRPPPAP